MSLVTFFLEHGFLLIAGSSLLLGAGTIVTLALRAPLDRQRAAELTLIVTLLWLAVAPIPLPRSLSRAPATTDVAPPSPPRPALPPLDETGAATAPAASSSRPFAAGLDAGAAPGPTLVPAGATASEHRAAPVDVAELAARAYLAGAVLCIAFLAIGALRLVRILRRGVPTPEWLARLILESAERSSEGRSVLDVLRVSASRARPFCFGLRRPTIVLPAVLCRPELGDSILRVLRHEWAHATRRDGIGQALFAALMPLLYIHPFYWWLRAIARQSAELLADEVAARPAGRNDYARHLIRVAGLDLERTSLPVAALTLFGSTRSPLERRIKMLVNRRRDLRLQSSWKRHGVFGASAVAALAVSVGWLGAAPASEPTQDVRKLEHEILELRAENERLRADMRNLRELVDRWRESPPSPPMRPPADPATIEAREVKVTAGDSLSELYRLHVGRNLDLDEVQRLNPDLDPSRLAVGSTVRLPRADRPDAVADLAWIPTTRVPAKSAPSTTIVDEPTLALITRLIELKGAARLARKEFAVVQVLAAQGRASEQERLEKEIAIETTDRMVEVLTFSVEAELQGAEKELEQQGSRLAEAAAMHDRGLISTSELRRLEGALERTRARFEVLRRSR